MGYHPETLAFSFPPHPRGGASLRGFPKPMNVARALYALKPWIGFDIWHIDPERPSEGQRTDDSCGWFDRRPGEYADAVQYLLNDKELMHEVRRALATRANVVGPYGHEYQRMSQPQSLAVTTMVARYLELRRWWNGQNGNGGAHASLILRAITRQRDVSSVAFDLALNPIDNLSSGDDPKLLIRLIAGALHRHFKPWWKHPRWHVHHWKINFDLARNLKRMVQPCATCRVPLGFGYSPTDIGDGSLHHSKCAQKVYAGGMGRAPCPSQTADDVPGTNPKTTDKGGVMDCRYFAFGGWITTGVFFLSLHDTDILVAQACLSMAMTVLALPAPPPNHRKNDDRELRRSAEGSD